MPHIDLDELGRAQRALERTERDLSLVYDDMGRLGAEVAQAFVEAVRAHEAFRSGPARMLAASGVQEMLRSVTAQLVEASEIQEALRSVNEMLNRTAALEMERLRPLLHELVSTASEIYAAQARELARGISGAAAVQFAAALPSADMPVVTIPYRPRPAPDPAREVVVYVPQEQEEEGDLLKRIGEHSLLVLLASRLVPLITLAYLVADHHPHIFAWSVEQLLRTAEQLLQYID